MRNSISFFIVIALSGCAGQMKQAPDQSSFNSDQKVLNVAETNISLHHQKTAELVEANKKLASSKQMLKKLKNKEQRKVIKAQIERAEAVIGDRQCFVDEGNYMRIERALVQPWEEAWRRGDFKSYYELTSKEQKLPLVSKANLKLVREFDGIKQYRSKKGKAAMLTAEAYLGQFSKVEDFELDVISYDIPERYPDGVGFNIIHLNTRFDMRGFDQNGHRVHDRGIMNVKVMGRNDKWLIHSAELHKAERLVSARKAAFVNRTVASQLNQIPVDLRQEAIRRGGYALSVADINNDGKKDLFVGGFGPSTVWLNDGKGAFVEDKDSGLAGHTFVKSAVFTDFNNDGILDLALTRFIDVVPGHEEGGDVRFFRGAEDGSYTPWSNLHRRTLKDHAMPATVADFNQDGLLDLYVGYPGRFDFTQFEAIKTEDDREVVQGLFYNSPEGMFVETTGNLKQKDFWPHASLATDWDADGDMDLVVIDDRNNLSAFYENTGKGQFEDTAKMIGVQNEGYGMGIEAVDLDNDQRLDFLLTNVNFASSQRIDNSCRLDKGQANKSLAGLRYFNQKKNKKFVEQTDSANLGFMGWGASGVTAIDYNNDGHMDIYVSNGLWTGSDRNEDLDGHFGLKVEAGEQDSHSFDDSRDEDWLNYLRFAKGKVDHEGKVANPSLAGFQRNRLFRNNGDDSFTEVGFIEGADSIADGYMIAKADINDDGRMDLILRNGDPGVKEDQFSVVEIFENQLPTENNYIRLTVNPRQGEMPAVGAMVYMQVGKEKLVQQQMANNGAVQSEQVLHFGLGKHEFAKNVKIVWPDGEVEKIGTMRAGTYNLTRGQINNVAAR